MNRFLPVRALAICCRKPHCGRRAANAGFSRRRRRRPRLRHRDGWRRPARHDARSGSDFEVRDEGKPQPITLFDNTPQPIRLIVMLDVSGSMEGNLPLLRDACRTVVRAAAPGRRGAGRARSGATSTISPSFTRNVNELRSALPTMIAPDAPTPLWRALEKALEAFDKESDARPVILVLSDGKDSGMFDFSLKRADQPGGDHRSGRALDAVMIYAIGMRSQRLAADAAGRRARRSPGHDAWPTCPIPASHASRRKPAAAIWRFAPGRTSPPPSRASPTNCTANTCSASRRPSATGRGTTSTCG